MSKEIEEIERLRWANEELRAQVMRYQEERREEWEYTCSVIDKVVEIEQRLSIAQADLRGAKQEFAEYQARYQRQLAQVQREHGVDGVCGWHRGPCSLTVAQQRLWCCQHCDFRVFGTHIEAAKHYQDAGTYPHWLYEYAVHIGRGAAATGRTVNAGMAGDHVVEGGPRYYVGGVLPRPAKEIV